MAVELLQTELPKSDRFQISLTIAALFIAAIAIALSAILVLVKTNTKGIQR